MAIEYPAMIENRSLPQSYQHNEARMFAVLKMVNIVCPVLEFVAFLVFYLKYNVNDKDPDSWFAALVITTIFMVGMCQFVSGFILVRSVMKIRAAFKEQDYGINTCTFFVHACAFGVYLAWLLLFYVSQAVFYTVPDNEQV